MHKFKLLRVHEADKGTASGDTGDATGTNGGEQQPAQTFSTDDVERIVKERLERAERKAKEKADKDREAADAAKLAENQQYKELADKATAKATKLEADYETTKEKAERYEAALTTYLATQRKTVPSHLHGLLDKLDPVDQLEWIAANGDKLTQPAPVQGVPGTPKQNGNQSEADAERARASHATLYRGKF